MIQTASYCTCSWHAGSANVGMEWKRRAAAQGHADAIRATETCRALGDLDSGIEELRWVADDACVGFALLREERAGSNTFWQNSPIEAQAAVKR